MSDSDVNQSWACGITTVPSRLATTLPITLESLRAAGFDKPKIMVDGRAACADCPTYRTLDDRTTFRGQTLRTAAHWHLSLAELYLSNPFSDRYALFQDDVIACRNVRPYLECCAYPERGYLNLMTAFQDNERIIRNVPNGWHESALTRQAHDDQPSRQNGRGAVALVFSREAVLKLLSNEWLWRRHFASDKGWRKIDGGIVEAMNAMGWREYIHKPSLVQHIGTVSAMGNVTHPKALTFPGEEFDALGLIS